MIVLVIIVLILIGLIGGAFMCDAMMADGCLETVVGFTLGALMFIGMSVGIVAMMVIIIEHV